MSLSNQCLYLKIYNRCYHFLKVVSSAIKVIFGLRISLYKFAQRTPDLHQKVVSSENMILCFLHSCNTRALFPEAGVGIYCSTLYRKKREKNIKKKKKCWKAGNNISGEFIVLVL